MAITNLLAPIPKWPMINNEGTLAGGAKLYTYRSLNKIQQKIVYEDAGGTIPYTNPIIFDLNGVQGPFYWSVNSADLSDTYYLEAYDADDNLLWTVDNYFPPGAGGGGNVTTYVPLKNLIANNVYINHVDNIANPLVATDYFLAPSNHHQFTPNAFVPIVGTFGVVAPDMHFVKNNTAATDAISWVPFALGLDPLTGDITPAEYLRYQCTNNPVGETYKSFQFPIQPKVNTLDNQSFTFTLWAKVAATATNLTLYVRQYFGTGGAPSAEVRTNVGTISLTTTWTKATINFVIPTVAGKTLGDCGDDATYLQLDMPLGIPCDVWFCKPSQYLGSVNPTQDFETYDQIDSVIQTPRMGQIMETMLQQTPGGWVPMNDGSIGNVLSAATTRANLDTFFLFKTIWDGVSNTYAPVQDNTGTPVARGASAVADFIADRRLVLPSRMSRVTGASGSGAGLTARAVGEFTTIVQNGVAAVVLPVAYSNEYIKL